MQPEWNPHDTAHNQQEASYLDSSGQFRKPGDREIGNLWSCRRFLHEVQLAANYGNTSVSALACAIQSATLNVAAMHITGHKRSIDAPTLARNWGIGLQAAKQTVKVTTQRGIRSIANPSLSRRFRTNDRQLRY